MSRSIYCKPRLILDGREVSSCSSVQFKDSGGNSLSSIAARFSDPDLENSVLYNKSVEYFLNYGSEDCVPLFRGVIKEFSTTGKDMSITALDSRSLITGENSFPVVIDDKDNYDGQTIVEFLIDVIDNRLNSSLLSTSALNGTDKPIFIDFYGICKFFVDLFNFCGLF